MSLAFYILAAEEDAIYKLVPFLIILVIWALGAIASAINKSKPKQRQTPLAPPPPIPPQKVMNRPAPPVAQIAVARQGLPPLPTIARKAARGKKVVRTPGPPPLPQAPAAAPAPVSRPAVSRSVAPSTGSIAAWLRPQTVRSQFALSEILGKPVALKDRPHLPSL